MSTARTRIKQKALIHVPQDKEQCAQYINEIGRLTRQIMTTKSAMNDEIADITDRYTEQFSPLEEQLDRLRGGVQVWCEAHRDELTDGGKTKSGQFVTGTVQWRQKPPRVMLRGVNAVIDVLKKMGLDRFVRIKEEVNKEAVLNEPEAVSAIPGLTVKTGEEDFVITPFEQDEH